MKKSIINSEDDVYNKILVIGNGFDLANEYKTRYRDFIEFIKKKKYKKYKTIKSYNNFVNLVNKNCFIQHFHDLDYMLWSDVETEMHKVLSAINYVYNSKEINYESVILPDSTDVMRINTRNPYIVNVLLEFNMAKETQGHYIMSNEYFDFINGIKWKVVDNYMEEELYGFKQALIIYLKEFVPLLHKKKVGKKTIRQLASIKPDSIITFNYTDFYTDLYECKNVNHVHGNLIEENIVLGYEDNCPDNFDFVKFKKYFQRIQNRLKPLDKNDPAFNVEGFASGFLSDSNIYEDNIVYFYGLSFDVTDKDYIEVLFDLNNTVKKVIYFYDEKDYENKIINLMRIFGKEIIQEINNKTIEFVQVE